MTILLVSGFICLLLMSYLIFDIYFNDDEIISLEEIKKGKL